MLELKPSPCLTGMQDEVGERWGRGVGGLGRIQGLQIKHIPVIRMIQSTGQIDWL